MDIIFNAKIDKHTIYEIYRACRLCGAGAGYKMPIIQNVIDLDANGIELKQKIRDCVQIEVNSDDKMPPLICELCVDKVNDFYEFQCMCQQTNKRTRARLGLPLYSGKDSGDCILGVTEQVYANDDSDEPLSVSTTRKPKAEPKVKIKVEKPDKDLEKSRLEPRSRQGNSHSAPRPSLRSRPAPARPRPRVGSPSTGSRSPSPRVTRLKRPATPPRASRAKVQGNNASSVKDKSRKSSNTPLSPPPPKSILKRAAETRSEEVNRSKRSREPSKPEVPQKKVKLAPPSARPRPRRASPPPAHACAICRRPHNTSQALGNHMRAHTVSFTSVKLSCNACEEWFTTLEETAAHHRTHRSRPYRCRKCRTKFTQQQGYDEHIARGECVPCKEAADVRCGVCWRCFPTRPLAALHRCGGRAQRPGGNCSKCGRPYALLKNLKKHEETCTEKIKNDPIIDPAVKRRLLPASVRMARCDELLANTKDDHVDVSCVRQDFGLDPCCVYPYLRRAPMVTIKAELDELSEEELVHWDSDSDSGTVESLASLSLKTIFSKKLLGKVPRKRRKVKTEKDAFDSILATEFDGDLKTSIDNIIDNLNDDSLIDIGGKNSESNDNDSVNSESLLCTDNGVKFNDFNDSGSQLLIGPNVNDRVDNILSGDFNSNDKDGASTDCETEIEDEKEPDETAKEVIGSTDKDLNDVMDSINYKESSNNDNQNNNRELGENDESKDINDDSTKNNNHSINSKLGENDESKDIKNDSTKTDRQMNGHVDEKEKIESTDDLDSDKKLMDDINEQIGEDDENNTQSEGEKADNNFNDEKVVEKVDKTTIPEEGENKNEQISENNDKTVDESSGNSENDKVNEVNEHNIGYNNDENVIESSVNHESGKLSENDKDSLRKLQDENEAMCNDIENKINDLIALRNPSDTNYWNNLNAESNDKNSVSNNDYNGDHIDNSQKQKVYNESFAENNDNFAEKNDNVTQSNDNLTVVNDSENDKISLEDLLPPKDPDLDSISDTEFDFDA